MYKVYQIRISKEVSDYVNSNGRGHVGGMEKYPEYLAKQETSMKGAEGWRPEFFAHYTKVCEVAREAGLVWGESQETVMINDLEEVFKVLNGYHYNEDREEDLVFDAHVSGYSMKTVTRKTGETVEFRDMHSLSVGDIVYDVEADTYNIVDSWGFKQLKEKDIPDGDKAFKRIQEAS